MVCTALLMVRTVSQEGAVMASFFLGPEGLMAGTVKQAQEDRVEKEAAWTYLPMI